MTEHPINQSFQRVCAYLEISQKILVNKTSDAWTTAWNSFLSHAKNELFNSVAV